MSDALTPEQAVNEMLEALPELRQPYRELQESWGEPDDGQPIGLHIVMGDVLNPLLVAQLRSGEDEELLSRAFAFVERMAASPDDYLVNVVAVTVCEHLGGDHLVLARARSFMGPRTSEVSRQVEDWWQEANASGWDPPTDSSDDVSRA